MWERSKPLLLCLIVSFAGMQADGGETSEPGQRQVFREGWQLKSSFLVAEEGARVSTAAYRPQLWHTTSVPSTVLSALVKNGVYPDPRIGLDCYRIPDSSDEFNRKYDLAKFSYLPGQAESMARSLLVSHRVRPAGGRSPSSTPG